MASQNVYEIVTGKILAALESGDVPWRKPWHTAGLSGGNRPRNANSGRYYNGINVFLLDITAFSAGYTDNRWLTFKGAQQADGNVRKGERGTLVIFWSFIDKRKQDDNGEWYTESVAFLRYYTVFNVQQCENLNPAKLRNNPVTEIEDGSDESEPEPLELAEAIVNGYSDGPTINVRHSDRAYYNFVNDEIVVPERKQYVNGEEYYSTLFHELGHSTGHQSRLNRFGAEKETGYFGSPTYSREELVAEFTSAFLCAEAGIDSTIDNSAAYIKGWHSKLSNDPKLVVIAAARASKAANWILGIRAESAEAEESQEAA